MAKLTLMRNVKYGTEHLVGILETLGIEKCVMFIDADGHVTYGTKQYLEDDYVAVSQYYTFTIRRGQ